MKPSHNLFAAVVITCVCGGAMMTTTAWADGWHTIPKTVPAMDVHTGAPMYAPVIPYGHYADKFYLHGTARHLGLDQHAAALGSHLHGLHGHLGNLHQGHLSGLHHGGWGVGTIASPDACGNCGSAVTADGACLGQCSLHGGHLQGLGSHLHGLKGAVHPGAWLSGHHNKMDWFVGPGGPVPLTPGYVPYINPVRAPRDFFAFPPYADNLPY